MAISNDKSKALAIDLARELAKERTIGVYYVVFSQNGSQIEADGTLIADHPHDQRLFALTQQMQSRLGELK